MIVVILILILLFLAVLLYPKTSNRFPYIKPYIPVILGAMAGIIFYLVDSYILNRGSQIETFEDAITNATISQVMSQDKDQVQVTADLYAKYQDLLKRYTELLTKVGTTAGNSLECQTEIKIVQTQLDQAIKQLNEYKDRIRVKLPEYIQKNYVRRDSINMDFQNYDVTKHPDFTLKCTETIGKRPNVGIAVPSPTNEPQSTTVPGLSAPKTVTVIKSDPIANPNFKSECLTKCSDPAFFDIRNHPSYRDFNSYDVTKHVDFQTKCADPAFFNIQRHRSYVPPVESSTPNTNTNPNPGASGNGDILQKKVSELQSQIDTLTIQVKEKEGAFTTCQTEISQGQNEAKRIREQLEQRSLQLEEALKQLGSLQEKETAIISQMETAQAQNAQLKRELAVRLNSIQVSSVKDCPNLDNIIRLLGDTTR